MRKTPLVGSLYSECTSLEEIVHAARAKSIRNQHHQWWIWSRSRRGASSMAKIRRMFEEQTRDFDVHSG